MKPTLPANQSAWKSVGVARCRRSRRHHARRAAVPRRVALLPPSSSCPADPGAGNTVKQSDLANRIPTLEREELCAPDGQLRLEKPFLCSVTQAAAVPFARWIAVRFCKTTAIIAQDLLANGSWRILFLSERRRMLTVFIMLLRLNVSRLLVLSLVISITSLMHCCIKGSNPRLLAVCLLTRLR